MDYTNIDIIRRSPKEVRFFGDSRTDLRAFPREARSRAGAELRRVQVGKQPLDWKPMKSVGPGVAEIRVHTLVEHRIIYVAKFPEAVYVLHAFEKRTQKTPDRDINLARRRLAQVLRERQP